MKNQREIKESIPFTIATKIIKYLGINLPKETKERWLCGRRRAKRSHSTFKVRRGSGEEIPLVQGKEQRLHFAGAAVKRYPTSKVRETQVRQ